MCACLCVYSICVLVYICTMSVCLLTRALCVCLPMCNIACSSVKCLLCMCTCSRSQTLSNHTCIDVCMPIYTLCMSGHLYPECVLFKLIEYTLGPNYIICDLKKTTSIHKNIVWQITASQTINGSTNHMRLMRGSWLRHGQCKLCTSTMCLSLAKQKELIFSAYRTSGGAANIL